MTTWNINDNGNRASAEFHLLARDAHIRRAETGDKLRQLFNLAAAEHHLGRALESAVAAALLRN